MAGKRLDYIDWLRVTVIAWIITNHAAVPFIGRWYVSNRDKSPMLSAEVLFGYQWHLPLLFLLAGMSTYHALARRSPRQYLKERAVRMLVPLAFGTIVLVPPIVYAQKLSAPAYRDSYQHFFRHFFDAPYPRGDLQWGHLWFLAYLLAFSLITLPLFLYLRGENGQRLIAHLAALAERRGGLLVFALPVALVEAGLRPGWIGFPQNLVDDWANVLSFLLYMVYGYLYAADERFATALDRRITAHAVLGVAASMVTFALFAGLHWPPFGYSARSILLNFLRGWNIWFWVALALALGRRYLNFSNRLLDYAREASYPLYVLHLTVVVGAAFYVTRWEAGVAVKFACIAISSWAVLLVLYEVAVKPWSPLRFLFGMRSR